MHCYAKNNPDFKLLVELFQVTYLLNEGTIPTLIRYKLTPQSFGLLLDILYLNNSAMPTELARLRNRQPQAITAMVNNLIRKGFCVRTRDKEKKNICKLSVTTKGQLAAERISHLKIQTEIFSALSKEQRELFEKCLELLERRTKKLLNIAYERSKARSYNKYKIYRHLSSF